MRFPSVQFSILQLLELTAIVALSLAIDRMPWLWRGGGLTQIITFVPIWGALSGTYLAWRWCKQRKLASLVSAAGVATAILTLLNAIRIGVSIAERLRRDTDGAYFGWAKDWPQLVGAILGVTLVGTGLAVALMLVSVGISTAWVHFWKCPKSPKISGDGKIDEEG